MSVNATKLKVNKLLKNPCILFDDYPIEDGKANRSDGRLITGLTTDINDMIGIINSDDFIYRLTKAFYTDRKWSYTVKGARKTIDDTGTQNAIYTKVKEKCPSILKTSPNTNTYNGCNLFYYMGGKLDKLESTKAIGGSLNIHKQIPIFSSFVENTIVDTPLWKSYDVIDIYVPIKADDAKVTSISDMKSLRGASKVTQMLLAMITNVGLDKTIELFKANKKQRVNFYFIAKSPTAEYVYTIPNEERDFDLTKFVKGYKSLRIAAIDEENVDNIELVDSSIHKKAKEDNKNVSSKTKVDPVVKKLLTKHVGKVAATKYAQGKANESVTKLGDKISETTVGARDLQGSTYSADEDLAIAAIVEEEHRPDIDEALEVYETKSVSPTLSPAQSRKLSGHILASETVEFIRPDVTEGELLLKEEYKSELVEEVYYGEETYDKGMSCDKLKRMDEAYEFGTYREDLMRMLKCWSRPTNLVPLYLQHAEFIPSSDGMNKREDLKVKFVDSLLRPHTFRVAIPTLIESNKIMKGGNLYTLAKQCALLPVVKTDSNEVQIISNQNKCFISRSGITTTIGVDILMNYLSNPDKNKSVSKLLLKKGKCDVANREFVNHIEYGALGSKFYKFRTPTYTVIFDQQEIRDRVADKIKGKDLSRSTVVAYVTETKEPIIADENGIITHDGKKYRISEWIYRVALGEITACKADLAEIKTTRKLAYSQVTILSRKIPLIFILSHLHGLTATLEECGVEYEFLAVKPRLTGDDRLNYRIVSFKDGHIKYSTKEARHELLLSGLQTIKTQAFNFLDLDDMDKYTTPDGIYAYLTKGPARISKGVLGFKEVFFDGITLDVLEKLKMSDNLLDLMLKGNDMLTNTAYTHFLDLADKRIRMPGESIAIALYHAISEEYLKYVRLSYTKEIRKSISLAYNSVFRHLMNSPLVEGSDKTQAIREIEDRSVVSFQGWGGLNIMEGYSPDKRSYHESHLGTFSIVGSAGTIGIKRHLVVNPPITNTRGFIAKVNPKDLAGSNILCASEAITPAATTDDGMRRSFIFNQNVDVVNCSNPTSEPPLITGYEAGIVGSLGDTYVKKARFDGHVVTVDEKNEILVVEYKLGKNKVQQDAFSFKKEVLRNGGAGIHLPNTFELLYKKGDTFKRGDVLIRSKEWFHGDKKKSSLSMGRLGKILLTTTHRCNEDSSTMRRAFGEDLAATLIDKKNITIGKYAVISKMVKIGDFVEAGKPLIVFENIHGDTTGDISRTVARVKADDGGDEEYSDFKKYPSSKHSGKVVDIEVLYTCAPEELGPDTKKIVDKYVSEHKKRNKLLNDHVMNKDSLDIKYVGVTEINNGMIAGEHVDEGDIVVRVCIEFKDVYTIGDKASFHSAAKSVTGFTLTDEDMPRGDFRPDEPVDFELAYEAVVRRHIKSPELALYANKVLVELKRSVADKLKDGKMTPSKRKNIESEILGVMKLLEPGGYNHKQYTKLFKSLSETGFTTYVRGKALTEGRHFQLELSSYDDKGFPQFSDIAKAAKFLDIPLEETITYPHFQSIMGEGEIPSGYGKNPVGYLMIKTPVQKVLKKEKQGVSVSNRDPINGQVTRKTKGGRMSYVDANVMTAVGMDMTLREMSTLRADNMRAKEGAAEQIRTTGTLVMDHLDIDATENISVRSADQLLLSGFVKTNMVSKSYKLKGAIKDSYAGAHSSGVKATTEAEMKKDRERRQRKEGATL